MTDLPEPTFTVLDEPYRRGFLKVLFSGTKGYLFALSVLPEIEQAMQDETAFLRLTTMEGADVIFRVAAVDTVEIVSEEMFRYATAQRQEQERQALAKDHARTEQIAKLTGQAVTDATKAMEQPPWDQ